MTGSQLFGSQHLDPSFYTDRYELAYQPACPQSFADVVNGCEEGHAKARQWRRGDSNLRRTKTEPPQKHYNPTTKRNEKPLETKFQKQTNDNSEHFQTVPQHKSGAHLVHDHIYCNDLAEVVKAWPALPEHIRAAIKALVRTHDTEET